MKLTVSILALALLVGCASAPVPRQELATLPDLAPEQARVFITAGKSNGIRSWSDQQVGPVYINGRQVGTTAKDEHFVVDLAAGVYEMKCSPAHAEKHYSRPVPVTVQAGSVRYLACNTTARAGAYFGIIGAIASEYLAESALEDAALYPTSKLVDYSVFR